MITLLLLIYLHKSCPIYFRCTHYRLFTYLWRVFLVLVIHLLSTHSAGIQMKTNGNIGLQFLARGLSISHEIRRISWNPYEIRQISWNPYEICWISWNLYEIQWISWNPADFRWNPPKLKSFCWNIWIYKVLGGFHMKSTGFHEIHMKSSGFHEIWQISCEIHPNWRVFAETSDL